MSLQTVQYVPPSRKSIILAKPVTEILAVAHQKDRWGNTFTNHWCIYLQTGSNSSVRLDMIPSHSIPSTALSGGSKGILVVSELNYEYSNTASKVVRIPSASGLRVSHIVDALVNARYDRYEFDRDGVGCRMWTTNILTLLQQRSWGITARFEVAKDAIGKLWPDGSALPLDRGAYY